jgi:hypothetical protein
MRDAADAGMQQRIVTFVSDACVLKFCLPNMRSTCRECGAGEGHMNELFGRLGARLGVDRTALDDGRRCSSAIPEGAGGRDRAGRFQHTITTIAAAGLSADHVPTGLRPFGLARKDSRDDAFGAIAGTVPGNSFDF